MLSHCLVSTLFTPRVRILRRGRTYVLGRDQKADFHLPSEVISRAHAELCWGAGGAFEIRDKGSKNGTRVNGVPVIGSRTLGDGDAISIGPFTLQYREYQGDISGLLEESQHPDADNTTAISRDALSDRIGQAAAVGFGGNFAGHELLEIVRLVAFGERDGVLTVHGEGEKTGQIGFEKGDIRRAVAGELKGEAAAAHLLMLGGGRFEFAAGKLTGDRNCRLRTDQFAVDIARRFDEEAGRKPAPPAPPPGAPASPVGDTNRLKVDPSQLTKRATNDGRGPA